MSTARGPWAPARLLLFALLLGGCHAIFPFDVPLPPDAAPADARADPPGDAPLSDFTGDLGFVCSCGLADGSGDGKVDLEDHAALWACMDKPISATCKAYDYNNDGKVDLADLICLKQYYGLTCGLDAAVKTDAAPKTDAALKIDAGARRSRRSGPRTSAPSRAPAASAWRWGPADTSTPPATSSAA
jgi:hypothetical protein